MNAADAGRVVSLTARIQTIQRALELLDSGATIIAMTLRSRPIAPLSARMGNGADDSDPETGGETPPPGSVPSAQPRQVREAEPTPPSEPPEPAPLFPEGAEPQPSTPASEPEGPSVGEITISTEGLVYPPQMVTAIRQQEIAMWRSMYEELERLGVTNVPAPPG